MKINSIIYKKLLAQAEEAKFQGLTVLANGILDAIGSYPNDEKLEYSYAQMKEDVHKDMWKIATRLMCYYDVDAADATKLNQELFIWANDVIDGLEETLSVNETVKGPLEPELPGENK